MVGETPADKCLVLQWYLQNDRRQLLQEAWQRFFHCTSELELSIQAEMKAYKEIWENVYFLRVLSKV